MSEDEILADFPALTQDDIRACLAFAADGERSIRFIRGVKPRFDQNLPPKPVDLHRSPDEARRNPGKYRLLAPYIGDKTDRIKKKKAGCLPP